MVLFRVLICLVVEVARGEERGWERMVEEVNGRGGGSGQNDG